MDKFVTIKPYNHTIAYKEWLPADTSKNKYRGIIICTHGIGDTAGAFDIVAPILANQQFRVLAIDLPGHGFSSHTGRYSLYHIAESLLHFIVTLGLFETKEDLYLVSHSFSAEAAPFLTGTYPTLFKKIVQLDNPGPVDSATLIIDPLTDQPYPTYGAKLKRFYNTATRTKKRDPPMYASVEEAANNRFKNSPSFFKVDKVQIPKLPNVFIHQIVQQKRN